MGLFATPSLNSAQRLFYKYNKKIGELLLIAITTFAEMDPILQFMRIEEVLAQNLKEIRKKRGLTQEDVAARVDMQPNYYATCERAEKVMSLEMLARVAKVLRVSPHVLLMPNGVDHIS